MQLTLRSQIRKLTIHSMFIALIAIMGFVPFLGFLPIGAGVSITLIHLPVLLGAILLTPRSATLFGFTFGVVSLLVVLTNPTPLPTDLFFINPMISIFPRIMFGLLAGIIFTFAKKIKGPIVWIAISVGSFIATLLHTVLVLSMLWIFESASFIETFRNLFNLIWFILSLNGLLEALLAAITIPVVYLTILQVPSIRRLLKHD